MANFFVELWESIFTPGPTPTLLVATNATFAALQVILAVLLFVTYSIHFLVLSVLCGGLWFAINWFARELREQQRLEEEKKRRAAAPPPASSSSDETETEVEPTARSSTASLRKPATKEATPVPVPPATKQPEAVSSVVEPTEARGELKLRTVEEESSQSQGVRSSASTEDEWEKVSENEKDK
ncbi:hypothetical protein VTJ04DRAFT_5945 [Mycothermus thermophilus]|uniref:uncharacterized protein n=1 Tax=Humicola insolens TaxID=85995 RepID=UPI003743AA42